MKPIKFIGNKLYYEHYCQYCGEPVERSFNDPNMKFTCFDCKKQQMMIRSMKQQERLRQERKNMVK